MVTEHTVTTTIDNRLHLLGLSKLSIRRQDEYSRLIEQLRNLEKCRQKHLAELHSDTSSENIIQHKEQEIKREKGWGLFSHDKDRVAQLEADIDEISSQLTKVRKQYEILAQNLSVPPRYKKITLGNANDIIAYLLAIEVAQFSHDQNIAALPKQQQPLHILGIAEQSDQIDIDKVLSERIDESRDTYDPLIIKQIENILIKDEVISFPSLKLDEIHDAFDTFKEVGLYGEANDTSQIESFIFNILDFSKHKDLDHFFELRDHLVQYIAAEFDVESWEDITEQEFANIEKEIVRAQHYLQLASLRVPLDKEIKDISTRLSFVTETGIDPKTNKPATPEDVANELIQVQAKQATVQQLQNNLGYHFEPAPGFWERLQSRMADVAVVAAGVAAGAVAGGYAAAKGKEQIKAVAGAAWKIGPTKFAQAEVKAALSDLTNNPSAKALDNAINIIDPNNEYFAEEREIVEAVQYILELRNQSTSKLFTREKQKEINQNINLITQYMDKNEGAIAQVLSHAGIIDTIHQTAKDVQDIYNHVVDAYFTENWQDLGKLLNSPRMDRGMLIHLKPYKVYADLAVDILQEMQNEKLDIAKNIKPLLDKIIARLENLDNKQDALELKNYLKDLKAYQQVLNCYVDRDFQGMQKAMNDLPEFTDNPVLGPLLKNLNLIREQTDHSLIDETRQLREDMADVTQNSGSSVSQFLQYAANNKEKIAAYIKKMENYSKQGSEYDLLSPLIKESQYHISPYISLINRLDLDTLLTPEFIKFIKEIEQNSELTAENILKIHADNPQAIQDLSQKLSKLENKIKIDQKFDYPDHYLQLIDKISQYQQKLKALEGWSETLGTYKEIKDQVTKAPIQVTEAGKIENKIDTEKLDADTHKFADQVIGHLKKVPGNKNHPLVVLGDSAGGSLYGMMTYGKINGRNQLNWPNHKTEQWSNHKRMAYRAEQDRLRAAGKKHKEALFSDKNLDVVSKTGRELYYLKKDSMKQEQPQPLDFPTQQLLGVLGEDQQQLKYLALIASVSDAMYRLRQAKQQMSSGGLFNRLRGAIKFAATAVGTVSVIERGHEEGIIPDMLYNDLLATNPMLKPLLWFAKSANRIDDSTLLQDFEKKYPPPVKQQSGKDKGKEKSSTSIISDEQVSLVSATGELSKKPRAVASEGTPIFKSQSQTTSFTTQDEKPKPSDPLSLDTPSTQISSGSGVKDPVEKEAYPIQAKLREGILRTRKDPMIGAARAKIYQNLNFGERRKLRAAIRAQSTRSGPTA